jgi:hypothetical protein
MPPSPFADCKRHGAGFALMTGLIEIGRQRGIGKLTGEVLLENKPMLQMCRELGFGMTASPNEPLDSACAKKSLQCGKRR